MKMSRMMMLSASASVLVLATLATPASADVLVNVGVLKTQDITILETITKEKDVVINVTATPTLTGGAEANALANVLNDGVLVDGGCSQVGVGGCTTDAHSVTGSFNIHRSALISNSINTNVGIVGVNQDVGNFANQANIVSFALSQGPKSVTESKAAVDQANENSVSIDIEDFLVTTNTAGVTTPINQRPTTINLSIDGNKGVTGVNQNSGNMNNQTNAIALAVGPGSLVALSDAALGQENTDDQVTEINAVRHEDITDSVNTNQGITQVNQSNGNFNNQGSVIAFSALTSNVTIGTPSP